VAELLRPPPRPSLGQRLGATFAAVTVTRLLTTAGAVMLVAVTAWWLLRSPAPPVERSLPSARSAGAGLATNAGAPTSAAPSVAAAPTTATSSPAQVVVQAAGAVTTPGVYRLAADARVVDVVTAAGGATADADLQSVALAAKVTDGARVYVPRVGEALPADAGSPTTIVGTNGRGPPTPANPLDLNQASALELEALPGVGPATAQAIITYRDERGPFTAVDDLLDVRGIGTAKLDAFRDLVRVG
jgi:competence protein ComEA